ncbi:hypothetical protein ABIC08_009019 [Bradyrhizobium sp. RT9b]
MRRRCFFSYWHSPDRGRLRTQELARSGAVKVRDPLWDKKQFEEVYAKLQSTRESVKKVRPSLTVTISQEGKSELLSAYTYGSLMSTNVGGSYY